MTIRSEAKSSAEGEQIGWREKYGIAMEQEEAERNRKWTQCSSVHKIVLHAGLL